MVGKTVHHYQFLEKLGAGGMGEIWKAQDTRLNRIVAVKILTDANAGDIQFFAGRLMAGTAQHVPRHNGNGGAHQSGGSKELASSGIHG